jgi:hypothetical protein
VLVRIRGRLGCGFSGGLGCALQAREVLDKIVRVPLRQTGLDVEREQERFGGWEPGLDAPVCEGTKKKFSRFVQMTVSLLCLDGHLQYWDVKIAVGRSSSDRFVKYATNSLA